MAREATISQEQVNAAADAIRAAGQQPTARAVRDALGTGSMATILKLLQTWKAGQVKAAPTDVTLPPALSRYLVDFVAQEVAKGRAEIEAELVASQQATADLIAENERQTAQIENLSVNCEALNAEKAEISGRLAVMESDLAAARDTAQAAEQAAESTRTELAKAQLRLEGLPRLESDLAAARADLAAALNRATEAEKSAAVASAQLTAQAEKSAQLSNDKALLSAKLESAEKQARADTQELSTLRLQVQAQQTALDTQTRELTDAKNTVKEARNEAKKSGEIAAELRGQLAAKTTAIKPK
ncbi:DNA-binding protein [Dechloromonas sp. ZY10]|uniref:DNA-binding protein n=1 Tax=Dechloromonas aquae TaxID=2664436 RepID=UPI003527C24B